MANKPYNPFINGMEPSDLDYSELTIRVFGDKDDFIIFGTDSYGHRYVLNIIERGGIDDGK